MPTNTFPVTDGQILYASGINFLYGLGSTCLIGTTAQGVFPKGNGDLLYPAEVNSFVSSPKPLFAGSTPWSAPTSAGSLVGSWVIGPGSASNPCTIKFDTVTENREGTSAVRWFVSGTKMGYYECNSSTPSTDGVNIFKGLLILGSPNISGAMWVECNSNGIITQTYKRIGDGNPGSRFVIGVWDNGAGSSKVIWMNGQLMKNGIFY